MSTLNLRLNKDAFTFAQEQIKNGNFLKSKKKWEQEKPKPEQEDAFLTTHSWHDYSLWFLALNCDEGQGTKAYYTCAQGNFEKICYSALVAAKQCAEENHYFEIAQAAATLLSLIDDYQP